MEVVDAVSICYRRGWRDKNLVTMTAIIGAETDYNDTYNDGEKFGLFGLRPHALSPQALLEANYCAMVARERYEKNYFSIWISYATGRYYNFVKPAIDGVAEFYLTLFKSELISNE